MLITIKTFYKFRVYRYSELKRYPRFEFFAIQN